MEITALAENTSASMELRSQHGLSLHIQTHRHRVLFDMGESSLFAENARKLGVRLEEVDIAILSHGHYDHGGGLETFLNCNDSAAIYLRPHAFRPCYADHDGRLEYIGIDTSLASCERLLFSSELHRIDDQLTLFSGVKGDFARPAGNRDLYMRQAGAVLPDDFVHEQNLLLQDGELAVLFTGCAHCGIVNILEHCRGILGRFPDIVLGGLHLSNPVGENKTEAGDVYAVADYLRRTGSRYVMGHCTGARAFADLERVLGDRAEYLPTGGRWIFGE